jgi:uroporphyrinogen decarboxylase
MKALSHRERVNLALHHKETDRVPIDLGGTISTTIILDAYDRLKEMHGFNHTTVERHARAHTAIPDEEILTHYGIDIRPIILGDFSGKVKYSNDKNSLIDTWGVAWKKAPDGHYININGPFQTQDPDIGLLEKHVWPDPDDPNLYKTLKAQIEKYKSLGDFALTLGLPLGVVHNCQFLRGFVQYLTDMYENADFIYRMTEIVCDIWIKIAVNSIEVCAADNIDIIDWGDDLGSQDGPLLNPVMYQKFIKPFHKKMNDAIKSRTNAKISFHTCGAVTRFMDDIIEVGCDILNPLQVSAKNMDPVVIKGRWGDRISFSGGIDTHVILPTASPDEIRQEVRRMVSIMAKDGGYILAAVHNIQNDVPPENIDAMFSEAQIATW